MSEQSNISLVMATYNGENYIYEQLRSIIQQTVLPDEIVIIDDNSTDNTLNIIREVLDDTQIEYDIIKNDINRGVNAAFEKGVRLATKPYIMFADQDDVWDKRKIEITKRAIEEDDSIVLVACDATIVDCDLNFSNSTMFKRIKLPLKFMNNKCVLGFEEAHRLLLKRNYITGMCMMVKKEALFSAIPFSDNMTYDSWIAWVVSNFGKICFVNIPLVLYRQHDNNVVGTKRKKGKLSEYFKHRKLDKERMYFKYLDYLKSMPEELIVKKSCNFYEWRTKLGAENRIGQLLQLVRKVSQGCYKLYTANAPMEVMKDVVEILFY